MLAMLMVLLASCSVQRYVPEGEYLLESVQIKSLDKKLEKAQFQGYIQQHPNSRWFNVLPVPMMPYMLSGVDTTRRYNRFMHKIGQPPVIYNAHKAEQTRLDIEAAVRNMGYLKAEVDLAQKSKGKKTKITYEIHAGERFHVGMLNRYVANDTIAQILTTNDKNSPMKLGMPFDVNQLDQERSRVSNLLRNHGYYRFNKDNIHFKVDTTGGCQNVRLAEWIETQGQRTYRVGNVNYLTDSLFGHSSVRLNALKAKTHLISDSLLRERDIQNTYSALSAMGAIMSSNIQLTPTPQDSTVMDATVVVSTVKPHSFAFEIEGTNSAGDLGAAVSLGYQNRNLMRGSELLNMKIRGAYEAIHGLSGYEDQDYIEYGAEASLTFPDLKVPFLSRNVRRRMVGTSEVSLMYGSQDRPEFHRRVVTGAWRYRWHTDGRRRQHRIDLMDLNYVFMPWISNTFRKDYLENESTRNAVLRYNYENLFIMKFGYQMNLSNQSLSSSTGSYGTNAWSLRLNMECAGNLLYGITNIFRTAKNSDGYYSVFNIAYAQYAKGDLDFTKSFALNSDNSLAIHIGLGLAYPYGNSTVLPYEKRYFSGGANSVRGWSVRELGPGTFRGSDGRVDFIRQTGDIKLDMNLEYRTHLFWLVDGAAFIDAGNIWTLRNYVEQPGGQFRFNRFWREIAVAYGLGIRLNFNYFILRLDGGMKAVNPAFTDSKRHYPIIHPNFKRDFALHFAVGLPF